MLDRFRFVSSHSTVKCGQLSRPAALAHPPAFGACFLHLIQNKICTSSETKTCQLTIGEPLEKNSFLGDFVPTGLA